ncbi:MAG: phage tail assembly chaperone [Kiloniellales bacterium]
MPPVSSSGGFSHRRAGAARLWPEASRLREARFGGRRKVGGGRGGKRTGAGQEETDDLDWSAFLEAAMGVIGWSPETFWAATPREFWAAFAGWRRAHGMDGDRAAGIRVSPQQMRATASSAPASVRSIRKLAGVRRGLPSPKRSLGSAAHSAEAAASAAKAGQAGLPACGPKPWRRTSGRVRGRRP